MGRPSSTMMTGYANNTVRENSLNTQAACYSMVWGAHTSTRTNAGEHRPSKTDGLGESLSAQKAMMKNGLHTCAGIQIWRVNSCKNGASKDSSTNGCYRCGTYADTPQGRPKPPPQHWFWRNWIPEKRKHCVISQKDAIQLTRNNGDGSEGGDLSKHSKTCCRSAAQMSGANTPRTDDNGEVDGQFFCKEQKLDWNLGALPGSSVSRVRPPQNR